MSAIYELLTFPKVSDAFSSYSTSNITCSVSPGDADHPRKIPRLADDSDSASASRSRDPITSTAEKGADSSNEQPTGPIVLTIVGAPYKPASLEGFGDECYNKVVRFLRVFVSRDSQVLPASYQAVYDACRTVVVIAGKGEGLYHHLKITLEKCVGQLVEELLKEKQQSVKWIAPFVNICVWFENRVGLLQSLLTYLDRIYLQERTYLLNIRSLAFHIFSNNMFCSPQITQLLRSGLQEWLHWERENRKNHELRPVISQLISHLITHDKYSDALESRYVDMTESYYSEESRRKSIAMKSDPAGFMIHCVARVQEEIERSRDMLLESSWELIRSTTERSLLQNQFGWVAVQGLPPLMETENINALGDMYASFVRVCHPEEVLKSFKSYVLITVSMIVGDKERDEEMVSRLLQFRAFANKTVNAAFVDKVPITTQTSSASTSLAPLQVEFESVPNQEFVYALADAFQAGFKSRRNKPAEMIAKYLDKAMRKGQRDASDSDFNAVLDSALELYRFTDDKDVFRTYYHRALAKRLLTSRSASDAFETAILKRLKEEYDPEFDMGENMFKDIALSRDLVNGYRQYKSKSKSKGKAREQMEEDDDPYDVPKFTVMVLQQSVWPFSARKQNVDLPSHMLDQVIGFTEFYKTKHQGHVLSWDHSLGNAFVTAQFKSGRKELLVSLYQAVVLVLFNDADEISFKDIKAMTSMDDADLRRTLQSLACASKKVLRKRPAGRDVNDDDKFCYNADFTHPRYQVRIDSIQVKETVEEAKRTEEGIIADRKFVIDAAIVRVMKARKERTFEQLKIDVVDAVKSHFVPDMKHFKERVDSLVEGEFLRRDDDNRDLFYYVA